MRDRTTSTGEYLAFLSAKYEVDADEFFKAFVAARYCGKSNCRDLSIERRRSAGNQTTFLILRKLKVVAQFSLYDEFLVRGDSPIRNYMQSQKVQRFLSKKAKPSFFVSIKDLRAGMRRVNLRAKVLAIPAPKMVCTRYGNLASVAYAIIEDRTGTIRLCLWNEQMRSVSVGDTISIENAKATTFRGERQLSLGRDGSLCSINEPTCRSEAEIIH